MSSNTVLDESSTPPTLTLDNCEFRNFIQNFNSFIKTNTYGGHIVITNTVFNRISSCGSIIRNFQKFYNYYYGVS